MNTLPSTVLPRAVSAEEKRAYEQDGVALLKQIYPPAWVDLLAGNLSDIFDHHDERVQQAGDLMQGRSETGATSDMAALLSRRMTQTPGLDLALEAVDGDESPIGSRSIVETDASQWHAGMREHNVRGPLAEIIHQLTGSTKVVFYSDQLFLKEAGSRVKTPFHQDKPYFLVSGGDVAVAWVPVDTVTRENGAMGYVRGSHLWGKTFKPSDFLTETGTLPEIEGIDFAGLDVLDHAAIRTEDIIYFDAEPGDVIVHNWSTLHGSTGNTSACSSRRAASVRYALDGCCYFQRPSSPEPFRKTITLADGEPLEASDRFPVVWPRTD